MSRVGDLVARGVRITAGNLPEGAGAEVPPEFFDAKELHSPARSALHADVQDLAAVYEEARVPPPFRGYGVDTMAQILESKRLASLPPEVRVAAVMGSLEAAGVSLSQVLRDAVLRERALDAFVAAREREVEALEQRNRERVGSLNREIETLAVEKAREIEGLEGGVEKAASAFAQLQLRKRQERLRLHEVLSHFVGDAENPIPGAGPTTSP
ncbi:MAG TPA: hypothetical protein VGL15_11440 [Vicinamibacteria bacterium]|jgi:hypothetical protein